MSKIDVINSYFKAWENKDSELLESLFIENRIAIRSFHGNLMFNKNELDESFLGYLATQFFGLDFEEKNDIVLVKIFVSFSKNNKNYQRELVVKFVFLNDYILRVYETVKKQGYSRIKCIVSYDGSIYSGFQRQPNLQTVQGDIEKGLLFLTKEKITIHSSGRTDKGVHANNQVFHFDTKSKINPNEFYRVLKSYLPDCIFLKSSELVSETFHSRYDTISKEYCYKLNKSQYNPIQRNYEWNVTDIDYDIFKQELSSIIGTYDFTSFTKTKEDKEMVRTIFEVRFEENDTHLAVYIVGSGFLQYMVRYLIGTSVEIAKGKLKESLLDFIDYKDASSVKWKAPSNGLYLNKVVYFK